MGGHLKLFRARISARWALFCAAEAVAVGFLFVPDARVHLLAYLSLFVAGSVLAFLAARSLSGSRPSFLLLCAAVFRLTLLFRPPDLSDDLWRYLWDGGVARAGISPWAHAPADPAVSGLDPALNARVAHREIRTVYPPAAQAVFRAFGFARAPFVLKGFFAAADLAVVALLAGANLPGGAWAAALYAFHPLPVTETAGQGHLDSLGVALLAASVAHALRGRRAAAGLGLALSALSKYVSAAAALPLARQGRWRTVLAAAAAIALIWGAAAGRGTSPAGGLDQYATRWEFNSVTYPVVYAAMEGARVPQRAKDAFLAWKARHHDPPWTARVFPYFYSAFFARAFLAIILGFLLLAIAWRVTDLWASVLASVGALLLVSPTLHPWYLLWVLPFAAARKEPAFLWLATAAPLAYAIFYPTPGISAAAVYAIEYVPFAALLLWPLLRRRSRDVPVRA
ncbi:MAG: glycosyltransferase 87 family protein [Acidobacteriota bacterium]